MKHLRLRPLSALTGAAVLLAACADAPTAPPSTVGALTTSPTELDGLAAAMADLRERLFPAIGSDPHINHLAADITRIEAVLETRDATGLAEAVAAARVAATALAADAPPDGLVAAADIDVILLTVERVDALSR